MMNETPLPFRLGAIKLLRLFSSRRSSQAAPEQIDATVHANAQPPGVEGGVTPSGFEALTGQTNLARDRNGPRGAGFARAGLVAVGVLSPLVCQGEAGGFSPPAKAGR